MNTNYDAKQKYLLMSIALMVSMIMLGLNAFQKKKPGAVVPVVGNLTETSPTTSEIEHAVHASMPAVDDAANAASEKSATSYQEVDQRLDRSVEQGVDAYEAGTEVAQKAMGDWSNETQPKEADVKATFNQAITTSTDG